MSDRQALIDAFSDVNFSEWSEVQSFVEGRVADAILSSDWLAAHDAEKRAEWEAERRAGDEATRRQIDGLASDYYEAIIRAERAEQGETEWEYGYELIEPDTRDVFERDGHYISTAFAYRAAKMRIHEERHPGVPGLQYSLIQRAKAGPWLPVPGSTVRESDSGVRDSDSEESESEK